MGIDDASQLHERVATVVADVTKRSDADILIVNAIKRFPSYYWLIILLPVFGGIGVFMVIFLTREFEAIEVRRLFLGGIAFYVAAIGLDYFDGIDRHYDTIVAHGWFSFDDARHLCRSIEEFIEMVGTTFILVSFLQHWRLIQDSVQPPDDIQ